MKIYTLLMVAFIIATFAFPSQALACACCAEPGTYSISTKKPTNLKLDELKRIRFADANIFASPAFPDDIKGISSPVENYSLNASLADNLWKFNFKNDANKSGTLNLSKPLSMVAYSADIHDGDGQSEIVLYKEWRFKYRVQSGSGLFQNGVAPATDYFLVLQGRGK